MSWIFVWMVVTVVLTAGAYYLGRGLAELRVEIELQEQFEKTLRFSAEAESERKRRAFLENTIDLEVERRLAKKIREWEPDPASAEEDFAKAERMAAQRDALNAGRTHPPRRDGGEPARVSKLALRTGPVDPKRHR